MGWPEVWTWRRCPLVEYLASQVWSVLISRCIHTRTHPPTWCVTRGTCCRETPLRVSQRFERFRRPCIRTTIVRRINSRRCQRFTFLWHHLACSSEGTMSYHGTICSCSQPSLRRKPRHTDPHWALRYSQPILYTQPWQDQSKIK